MAITYLDAVTYRAAKLAGTSFDTAMTLGHQRLYLHRQELRALRKEYHDHYGRWPTSLNEYRWGEYADAFLKEFLDVSTLTVFDASAYEDANVIHDMNHHVSEEWHNQFDVIVDCGSLEHIFNVPVALRNLAKMLAVGGTLFITTPANNLMGHGFYQFSPELMFRVFCAENGFEVRNLTLREAMFPSVELTRNRKLYSVADPQEVHKRVGLLSRHPAMMMVEAFKRADADVLATPPNQSDYVEAWVPNDSPPAAKSIPRRIARRVVDSLPRVVSARIDGRYQKRQFSLSNSEFYARVRTSIPVPFSRGPK